MSGKSGDRMAPSSLSDALLLYVLGGATVGLDEHAPMLKPWLGHVEETRVSASVACTTVSDQYGRRFVVAVMPESVLGELLDGVRRSSG